jgi:hypothetical protein
MRFVGTKTADQLDLQALRLVSAVPSDERRKPRGRGRRPASTPEAAVNFNFLAGAEFAYDPHPDSRALGAGQVKRQVTPEDA